MKKWTIKQRDNIRVKLKANNNNQAMLAKEMGITRQYLNYILKEVGLKKVIIFINKESEE